MDELLKFGYGTYSYEFDRDNQVSLQADFGDSQPKSAPILRMSGGAYQYGFDPAPSGAGNVQAYYWLQADNATEMYTKRDAIKAMEDWGPKQLIKRFQNGQQVWTWAVVTNVSMPQSVKNVPHRLQQVQINWHCPTGRWYGKYGELLFDSAESIFLDSMPAFTPKVDRVDVGDTDTVQVTNYGNTTAGAYVRWEAPTGVTIVNPTLTRLNEHGLTADSLQYTDTLQALDVVDIDARGHLLQENYVVTPSYDKLTVAHGGWLEIPPGTWDLVVSGSFTGGDGKLTVDIWDTWR